MATVTVSSRGQIVLPKRLRAELSIHEGDRVEIRREGNRLVLDPSVRPPEQDWRAWRGTLAGTTALEDHLKEHREEVAREHLP
jgi:AbrB family looped-hinge helix DNA binding protein